MILCSCSRSEKEEKTNDIEPCSCPKISLPDVSIDNDVKVKRNHTKISEESEKSKYINFPHFEIQDVKFNKCSKNDKKSFSEYESYFALDFGLCLDSKRYIYNAVDVGDLVISWTPSKGYPGVNVKSGHTLIIANQCFERAARALKTVKEIGLNYEFSDDCLINLEISLTSVRKTRKGPTVNIY